MVEEQLAVQSQLLCSRLEFFTLPINGNDLSSINLNILQVSYVKSQHSAAQLCDISSIKYRLNLINKPSPHVDSKNDYCITKIISPDHYPKCWPKNGTS